MSVDDRLHRASVEVLSHVWPDEAAFERAENDAEAAWLQSELLDATSQPIIAVNLDRTITYWNRAAEELYGWSAAEVLGRSAPEVMGREQSPDEARAIYEAMLRGVTWSGELEIERRDGTGLVVHVTDRPVFDRHGVLVSIIAIVEDVSKRNANEDARRRLAAIVDSSGDAMMSATLAGTVTSWNAAAERLLGFAEQEILGQLVSCFVPAERAVEQEQMRARLAGGGEPDRI
ncbi:MAG: hypothetical protein QOE63_1586 [Acidimicrobiaceae bacterium]